MSLLLRFTTKISRTHRIQAIKLGSFPENPNRQKVPYNKDIRISCVNASCSTG